MSKSIWGRVVVTFVLFVSVLLYGEYKDVPQSHWAYEAVEKLTNLGIVSGFPDGTFRGNETVTRFQVAMLLYRLYSLFDSSLRDIDNKISNIQARLLDMPQQSQISDIKQSVETLKNEQSDLKSNFKSDTEELRTSLNKLSQDLKKVSEDLKGYISALNKTNNSLNAADQKVDKLSAAQDSLRISLEELNNKYSNLSSRLETLEKSSKALSDSISKINNTLKELEMTLNSRLKELESSLQFQKPTSEDISTVETEIKELKERLLLLELLKTDVEKLNNKVIEIQNSISELRTLKEKTIPQQSQSLDEQDISTVLAEINMIQETIAKLSKNDEDIQNQVNLIKQSVDRVSKTLENFLGENQEIRERLDEFSKEIQKLSDKTSGKQEEANVQLASQLKYSETIIEELKAKILESAEIKAFEESLKRLSSIEVTINSLVEKVKLLEDKYLTNENYAKKDEIEELRLQIESIKELITELRLIPVDNSKVQALAEDIQRKNKRIDEIEEKLQPISDKYVELSKITDDLSLKLANISSRLAQESSYQALLSEVNSLKDKVKKVEDDVQKRATTAQLNSVNQNVQKVLSMVLDLQDKVKEIQNRLQNVEAPKENANKGTDTAAYQTTRLPEASYSTINAELSDLKNRVDSITKSIDDLKTQTTMLTKTVEVRDDKVSALEAKFDALTQKAEETDKAIASMRMIISDLEGKIQKLEFHQQALSKEDFDKMVVIVSALGEKLSHFEPKLDLLEKNFNELDSRTKEFAKSIDELNIAQNTSKDELSNLKNILNEHEKRINDVLNKYSNLELFTTKTNEEVTNNIKVLTKRLDEEHEIVANIQNELVNIDERISRFEILIGNMATNDTVDAKFNDMTTKVYENLDKLQNDIIERISKVEAMLTEKIEKIDLAQRTIHDELLEVKQTAQKNSSDLVKLKEEVETLKIYDQKNEQNIIFTNEQLKKLSESKADREQLSQVSESVNDLQKQLRELKSENENLKSWLVILGLAIIGIVTYLVIGK